jgi:hypothetical protein
VVSAPTSGQLELATRPGVAVMSFTQADIDAGSLVYVHDGSAATADSFEFMLSDASGANVGPIAFALNISQLPSPAPPLTDLLDAAAAEDEEEAASDDASTDSPTLETDSEEADAQETKSDDVFAPRVVVLEARTTIPWAPNGTPVTDTPSFETERAGDLLVGARSDRTDSLEGRDVSRAARLLMGVEADVKQAIEAVREAIESDGRGAEEANAILIQRTESLALAVGAGLMTALLRSASLSAVAISSLPLWNRFDPIVVLALDDEQRAELARELEFARKMEDETSAVGRMLDAENDETEATREVR